MVLEAIEDHLRGWHDDEAGLGGERVTRGSFHIEHVMPQKWVVHWALPVGARADEQGGHRPGKRQRRGGQSDLGIGQSQVGLDERHHKTQSIAIEKQDAEIQT